MSTLRKFARAAIPPLMFDKLEFLVNRVKLFRSGTWPLFRATRTLKNSAKNPDTFNKKIRYKMAYDRRSELTRFADKVAVRKYVERVIGEGYLTELYRVLDRNELNKLPLNELPRNFVIKASHGSGAVIIVSDQADELACLPSKGIDDFGWDRFLIHPNNADWPKIKLILKKWLNTSYYFTPGYLPEWAYKNIEPKILFEELLIGPLGVPDDYRFFVFDGIVEFIQVDTPVYAGAVTRDVFTRDWHRLNVTLKFANSKMARARPENLEKMIKIAEMLGTGIDHIRVDLYDLQEKIVFGELTNYHAAGAQKFVPESFDYIFGKSWHPDKLY